MGGREDAFNLIEGTRVLYSLGAVRGQATCQKRTPGTHRPQCQCPGVFARFPRLFTPPTLDLPLLTQPFFPCTASPEQHFT